MRFGWDLRVYMVSDALMHHHMMKNIWQPIYRYEWKRAIR